MATAAKDSGWKDPQNGSVRVEIFDQAYNLRWVRCGIYFATGGIRGCEDAGGGAGDQHHRHGATGGAGRR